MRRLMLILSVLLVATGGAVGAWHFAGSGGEAGLLVETAAVSRGDIRRTVFATGTVHPRVNVEVGSQLSGNVAELHADYNTVVETGQLIARIDPQSFESRVVQAEADLSVAEATVSLREASRLRALAALDEARSAFERVESLAARGNASGAALDTAQANLARARAEVAMEDAQIATARATMAQRQAALDTARIDLDRTAIRSPIDGIVINRAVSVGQTVAASLSAPVLFQIAGNLDRVLIETAVDEADIGHVAAGNPVSFRVDTFPGRLFEGVVEQVRLSPVTENNVVTYVVVVAAENGDRSLLPGMTATVEITTGARDDTLRIPNAALRFEPPQGDAGGRIVRRDQSDPAYDGTDPEARPATVWVEEASGVITPRAIVIGLADLATSELLAGDIDVGDRLVTRIRARAGTAAESGRRGGQ